jgi:hypothetical protein
MDKVRLVHALCEGGNFEDGMLPLGRVKVLEVFERSAKGRGEF